MIVTKVNKIDELSEIYIPENGFITQYGYRIFATPQRPTLLELNSGLRKNNILEVCHS